MRKSQDAQSHTTKVKFVGMLSQETTRGSGSSLGVEKMYNLYVALPKGHYLCNIECFYSTLVMSFTATTSFSIKIETAFSMPIPMQWAVTGYNCFPESVIDNTCD